MSKSAASSSRGSVAAPPRIIGFQCKPLLLEKLADWLTSIARPVHEASLRELSVVHFKGFGKTMDIRARPPPEDMLSMLRRADVLEFDGDDFEVAPDSGGIGINFACALPMLFASGDSSLGSGPALLAFKLEDEKEDFLHCWHGLCCSVGSDQLPIKLAPNSAADHIIDIMYVLVPRSVCSPDYCGGVLWSGAAGSKLPLQRSHVFASILDDAKRFAGSHPISDGIGKQANILDEKSSHLVSSERTHEAVGEALHDAATASLHFFHAQENKLTQRCKYYVSLGTLATLATAAIDDRVVRLERQVVAWGGYHIVACEFAAESALYLPNFAESLPWSYFHTERTKKVGSVIERQEGLLKGVQHRGLHCL